MAITSGQQSRLDWALKEIDRFSDEYKKIINVLKDYAKNNGYTFNEEIAQGAYNLLIRATLLREESKWSSTSGLLSGVLNIGMLTVINDALNTNRTVNDYIDNNFKLSSDLDQLYDVITKKAMYTFFYVLSLYRKIQYGARSPFGSIDDVLCALNYGYRGQDNAKTFTNNYISQASSVAFLYSVDRYTFNNLYNWIGSGFICDMVFYNDK